MATATSRIRALKQVNNTNPDVWGGELNTGALDLFDEAFGTEEIAVGANVTLTVNNYLTDQSRNLVLILSGAGGFTITAPAVDKPYFIVNDCSAAVTVQPDSGTGASIPAGARRWYYTNAAGTVGYFAAERLDQIPAPTSAVDLNSQKLTSVGIGTASTDAASLANKLSDFAAPDDALDANSQKIENLAAATASTDAASLANRLDQFAAPTSAVDANSQKIENLGAATVSTDAASLANRLDQFAAPTASVAMNSQKLTGLQDGATGTQDAASINQVETLINQSTMNLPTFAGNSEKFLRVNTGETAAEWGGPVLADISDAGSLAALNSINNTNWSGTDLSVANGGTGASTHTANAVLLGQGASAIASTGPGTSGQVLTSNGAGSDPTFQDASGGGLIPIGTKQTISGTPAAIDISLADGYDEYILKLFSVVPATDAVDLYLRTSTDSGSTFDSGASDYGYGFTSTGPYTGGAGTIAMGGALNAAQIQINNQKIGSDTNEQGVYGDIHIYKPGDSKFCYLQWCVIFANSQGSDYIYQTLGVGQRKALADVTDIRLLLSSGNFESGQYQLYGVSTL